MIEWTIACALASGLFDDVFVATEDHEIRDVAVAAGAKVPLLMPAELTGDLVASHRPCTYLLEQLFPDIPSSHLTLVCLQPTSPLRSVDDLRAAVQSFTSAGSRFHLSVTPIDPHYFHWALQPCHQVTGSDTPNVTSTFERVFGDQYMIERPLLPPRFRPNGSIKIARLDALAETGHFFGHPLTVTETPEDRSIHVATQFDLDVCDFLLRRNGAVQ